MRIYFSNAKFVNIQSVDKITTKINGDTVDALSIIIPKTTADIVREQFSDSDSLDVITVRDNHDIFVEKLVGYQKVTQIAFHETSLDTFIVTLAKGNDTIDRVAALETEFSEVKTTFKEMVQTITDAVKTIGEIGMSVNKAVTDSGEAAKVSSENASAITDLTDTLKNIGDAIDRTNQNIDATDKYVKSVKDDIAKMTNGYTSATAAMQEVLTNTNAIIAAGDTLKQNYMTAINEISGYITTAESTKEIAAENDHSMKIAIEQMKEVENKTLSYDIAIEEHGTKVAEAVEAATNAASTVSTYKQTVDNINARVSELEPIKDITTLPIEQAKAYRIAESKTLLAEYLEGHPITSSCHGGTDAQYSITDEKQRHLQAMILMTTQAVSLDIPYQPSWNSVGAPCSYDWTLEELQQLAVEIESVVRPLVSMQQGFEVRINEATTMEELTGINILYINKELEVH